MKKLILGTFLLVSINLVNGTELPKLQGTAEGFSAFKPTAIGLQLHCGTTTPLQGIAIGTIGNPNKTSKISTISNTRIVGGQSDTCTVYLMPLK